MTWDSLLRIETMRLYAQEQDIVPTLERLRTQAVAAHTHEILLRMIDAAQGRQARVALACAGAGWTLEPRTPESLQGWQAEVDEILDHREGSAALDAMILSLVQKMTRMRTACYETAYLLAQNLAVDHVANLLHTPWMEDRAADDRAAAVLGALIASGGNDWDGCFRLSQSA